MKRITLAALVLILASASGQAQPLSMRSDVDQTLAVKTRGYSPGTIGAMEAVTQGLATSGQDVERQQSGRSVASEPIAYAHPVATQAHGQSPGTVGAAPGQ